MMEGIRDIEERVRRIEEGKVEKMGRKKREGKGERRKRGRFVEVVVGCGLSCKKGKKDRKGRIWENGKMGREKGEWLCEKVDGRRGIEGRVRWIG